MRHRTSEFIENVFEAREQRGYFCNDESDALAAEVLALQAENKQALEALAVAAEYAHEQHEKNEKLIETAAHHEMEVEKWRKRAHRFMERDVEVENEKLRVALDRIGDIAAQRILGVDPHLVISDILGIADQALKTQGEKP